MRARTLRTMCLFMMAALFVSTGFVNVAATSRDDDVPMHVKFTYYWTYDPDYEGYIPDPQGRTFDLKRPDGTVIKTVDRGLAARYHMEGSGFIEIAGERTVINLVDDGNGNMDQATFDLFDYVDWGLDAPCYWYGLVPWRTIAVKELEIPMGSLVYIDAFKGKSIPIPDVNDPHNQSKWTWITHDGWFRGTDVSWSFQERQIDIFAATEDAYQYVSNLLGGIEELDIQVRPYNEVPSFITTGNKIRYRYVKVLGPQDVVAYDYDIFSSQSNPEQVAYGNFVVPHGEADVDDMLVQYPNRVYAAYDVPDIQWIRWAFLGDMVGIDVGDIDGSGDDETVMYVEDGSIYFEFRYGGPRFLFRVSPSGPPGTNRKLVTVGDYDGDGIEDIAASYGPQVVVAWMNSSGGVDQMQVFDTPEGITCLSAGDKDGDVDISTGIGKEEILVCSDAGIQYMLPNRDGTVAWTTPYATTKVKTAVAIKLDPDNKADILAVFEVTNGVMARYTSHKGGWVQYMDTEPKWLAPMTLKTDPRGGGSCAYDDWELYKWYYPGDHVAYDGDVYECTYYHYSQPGWEPDQPQMWAVWQEVGSCN